MKKDDTVLIKHILEAISDIVSYTSNIDETFFLNETMYQDAIIRKLEVIGEAANKLSPAFKVRHSNINWREIVGMRNVIAHEYFDIDLESIWGTSVSDLPDLKIKITKILKELL